MLNLLKHSAADRRTLYTQLSNKLGLHPQSIEKDLWVTGILQLVFSLPYADKLVFKGGSSLSKIWGLISRFSEDIDLAADRSLFDLEGDLTKKQLKKLRKASSVFVRDVLASDLHNAIEEAGLVSYCSVEPEPDGEGDGTYPEPRKVHILFDSVFSDALDSYVKPEVMLEVGSRSLFEPTAKAKVRSIISENTAVDTTVIDSAIIAAVPAKTFLEKAFLLHELFTTQGCAKANRKSRHLYDLERMMDCDFASTAISDDELWETIRHHREVFTSIRDVDYTPDIRDRIVLLPPQEYLSEWRSDYETMQNTMLYGDSLAFDELIDRISQLQERFRNR